MGKWHIQSTTSSLMYLKFTDWLQKQRFVSFVLKRKTALCFFSIYVCVYCAYIESTVVFFQSLIRVFQICLLNVGHACMYVCMCRVSSSTLLWWSHLVWHLLRYIFKRNFYLIGPFTQVKRNLGFYCNNLLAFNSARKTFNISSIALLIWLLLLLYGV